MVDSSCSTTSTVWRWGAWYQIPITKAIPGSQNSFWECQTSWQRLHLCRCSVGDPTLESVTKVGELLRRDTLLSSNETPCWPKSSWPLMKLIRLTNLFLLLWKVVGLVTHLAVLGGPRYPHSTGPMSESFLCTWAVLRAATCGVEATAVFNNSFLYQVVFLLVGVCYES